MIIKIIQTILFISSIIIGTLIGGGILVMFALIMIETHITSELFFWFMLSIPPFLVLFIPWYRLFLVIKTRKRGKYASQIDIALIFFSLAIGWLGMEALSAAAIP